MRAVVSSARGEARLAAARAWLAARPAGEEVLVVGATADAAAELVRAVAAARGSGFGWRRFTLGRLAAELAQHALAARGLAPVGALPIEALCARVVQALADRGALGRWAPVADRPGLPRALARTLGELRLAGATPADLAAGGAPEIAAALAALGEELVGSGLADRADVLALATGVLREAASSSGSGSGSGSGSRSGSGAAAVAAIGGARAIVLVDVPVRSAVEAAFVAALAGRAADVFATVPAGDDESARRIAVALGVDVETHAVDGAGDSLGRVQAHLFGAPPVPMPIDDTVAIFSAPGESRECVEIARRVLAAAAGGVPFDRMAVVLRAPEQYRVHIEEAMARAGVPVHFEHGTVMPDPTGRAFLALLACAAEGLSARRFAEYLSLGEVPAAADLGAPPAAAPGGERWIPPDEELVPLRLERALAEEGLRTPDFGLPGAAARVHDAPVVAGTLRAPWRWEKLLVEASVIGGRERWARRLAGLAARYAIRDREAAIEPDLPEARGGPEPAPSATDGAVPTSSAGSSAPTDGPVPTSSAGSSAPTDGPVAASSRRSSTTADDLAALAAFALPLLDDLAALPGRAPWGDWLDRLAALATRALRDPERVLGVLAALAPMAGVGPVALGEVLHVLHARLTDLVIRPPSRRHGRLLVARADSARGRTFDLVFVPGLAERMFPQKLVEDPLLLDAARARLPAGLDLPTLATRLLDERLALRLAVGAATQRLVLSYPRIDLEQGRPRVPSFYGLEVLAAAEGALPGFEELARRADVTGAARIGWPAPVDRLAAIDEAEHDLALLDALFRGTPAPGAAHYLLDANPHLARALRFRARRWTIAAWKPADGLVASPESSAEVRAALAAHVPSARAFSPTALEQLAACPYRFALRTLLRLQPRDEPGAIETLGPLERGSLVHEAQYELLTELRAAGELPVRAGNLAAAGERLDAALDRVAARYRDDLAPAIDRVWQDGIDAIRADLREWLRRMADDLGWIPARFELAFGPVGGDAARDPASVRDPVALPGVPLTLRGSIDLVEASAAGDGVLRAVDTKTGAVRVKKKHAVISGGTSLQPVLYALALEALFPDARAWGGRLAYCTSKGAFTTVDVPLTEQARQAAALLADTLALHATAGFYPAAPAERACTYCDFKRICGPHEERRAKLKSPEPLAAIRRLREAP